MTSSRCPIVGIGASAGGLDALKTLFQNLPADSGAAFVAIQHLDPRHESLTAEILVRCTAMPTVQVTNGMLAQPNPTQPNLAVLQTRTGHDFRNYKRATLRRRIARRMGLHLLQTLNDYVVFLREHADETSQLFNDLLIGVTAFFRDPDAWRALDKQAILPLVKLKQTDEPIRVFSPNRYKLKNSYCCSGAC